MAAVTNASSLQVLLKEARDRTLRLVEDLNERQMIGPRLKIINPPLWEIGHVAWFQEKWALRHLRGLSPQRDGLDELYDSAVVAHDTRWEIDLLSRQQTLQYMKGVLESVVDLLIQQPTTPDGVYFHLLPLYHEYMHAEALTYTRQTLGYPAPSFSNLLPTAARVGGGPFPGDVEVTGGKFMLGATNDVRFVFDNEKWAHEVDVEPFKIAKAPVTNEEFAAFVDDGGYREKRWWSPAGRIWQENTRTQHPVYWFPDSTGQWLVRDFDRRIPLLPYLPVIHVNWYEAEAYCNWAGRRLPTEAEWEMAASGQGAASKSYFPWGDEPPSPIRANLDYTYMGCIDVGALPEGDSAFGCRQMIGNVWEWTADDFQPYPGFTVDPYKEYSQPWFGDHKVLRGGCWATRSNLIRSTWRNFYTPDRRDVLAGFRTCSVSV